MKSPPGIFEGGEFKNAIFFRVSGHLYPGISLFFPKFDPILALFARNSLKMDVSCENFYEISHFRG